MKPGPALRAPDIKAMAPSLVLICSLGAPGHCGKFLTAKHVTPDEGCQMQKGLYCQGEMVLSSLEEASCVSIRGSGSPLPPWLGIK